MQIGIMGGTLDPVHRGHIEIANAVMQALALDSVMLLPAGDPPHKDNPVKKTDRLEMARLAASDQQKMFACSIEVFREGTTYTVDTLRELIRWNPNTRWFYIIGADTLDVLDTWRDFKSVAGLCRFAVVARAQEKVDPAQIERLKQEYGADIICISFTGPDISSTQIREAAAAGKDITQWVPEKVAAYIREKGLYLSALTRDEMLNKLKEQISPSRFQHTLGVEETAISLAKRFGADVNRARIAALLHDCAKYMPLEEMRRLVRINIPDADEEEIDTAAVLHAPAGAVVAQQVYGIKDETILSAIRKHTIGSDNMSLMDAIIYVADFIESGRSGFAGLKQARELAKTDIFAALRKCAQLSVDYLLSKGCKPHPKSQKLLE